MERHAAQAALAYIRDDMTIGLGSGKAVDYLIEFISMEHYSNLNIVTHDLHTALLASKRGLHVVPSWMVSSLDYTFDTLDYLISDETAGYKKTTAVLQDKLLASMAKKVVFMVSADNLNNVVTDKLPFEVEVVKEAISYVTARLTEMGAAMALNAAEGDAPIVSSDGNYIISGNIAWTGTLADLDAKIKAIPGVYADSIFAGLDAIALVYNKESVETLQA